MYDVLRFWLDRGVDGFRVDVLWHMIKAADFRDNPITYLGYFQLWARHDAVHTADMLRAIPERKEEPALKKWLATYGF